jgi:hypothetical protein
LIRNGNRPNRYGPDDGYYTAVVYDHGSLPQMGFSLHRESGNIDYFHYHSITGLRFYVRSGIDYIDFADDTRVVTLRGKQLAGILEFIHAQNLIALHQVVKEANENMERSKIRNDWEDHPYIQDVLVTDMRTVEEHRKGKEEWANR